MNSKKGLNIIPAALAICLATATAADAASTSTVFMSSTLVLIFVGFCALVVVIQLIPAIMLLFGMIKGALSGGKEKKEAEAKVR